MESGNLSIKLLPYNKSIENLAKLLKKFDMVKFLTLNCSTIVEERVKLEMPYQTPKERVKKALAFQETDFVPYHIQYTKEIGAQVRQKLELLGFISQIDNHLPFINIEPEQNWIDSDTYSDEFSSIWKILDQVPHLIDFPLKNPSVKNYAFPNPIVSSYHTEIEAFLVEHPDHFVFCGLAQGFYDRTWALRGSENLLMDFIENPLFIDQLFELLTDYYLKHIDEISKYPFDGIRFGDDWGAQRGVLMGPKYWRRFIKPGLKKIFEKARDKHLAVMVHSDGDIMDIIPDLIDMGVQILNPIQPEAMNIYEIKRRYGNHLCLNGGVSSQFTLPWGTPAEVVREVAACLQFLGKGGGYIIGPTKSFTPEIPFENILALFQTILNQPVKPLPASEPFPDCVFELDRVFKAFHSC